MAEHWPESASAAFASKSTWQPHEDVRRALGVNEAKSVKAQLNRNLSRRAIAAYTKIDKLLEENKHVMWYRLNLPADVRACVIINFRARVIVVHSYFISDHSANENEYIPEVNLVVEICEL